MNREYFKPRTTRRRADDIFDVWRLMMPCALYYIVQRQKVFYHKSQIFFLFLSSVRSYLDKQFGNVNQCMA